MLAMVVVATTVSVVRLKGRMHNMSSARLHFVLVLVTVSGLGLSPAAALAAGLP